jgi:hypothetical protein
VPRVAEDDPRQQPRLGRGAGGIRRRQAQKTKAGERFPGSTEVLESCFGRFKQLEKQQARGGFTSLLLGFGALVTETTTHVVQNALDQSATKDIYAWCKQHLGMTVFSQRKLAFAECATKAA